MPSGYRLRVLVGTDRDDLVVINPNDDQHPTAINHAHFSGQVWVRIRDFAGLGADNDAPHISEYFTHAPKMSYALVIQGQFAATVPVSELVFGNVFDEPLRLPPGSSIALRMLKRWVDPGLEADLHDPAGPWAWSPMLSTMHRVAVTAGAEDSVKGPDTQRPIDEDNALLFADGQARSSDERRHYFSQPSSATQTASQLHEHTYTMEFANGLADFNNFGVRIPGWGSISLMSFWDGQPLNYVLRTRDGQIHILMVSFQLVPVDAQEQTTTAVDTDSSSNSDPASSPSPVNRPGVNSDMLDSVD